MKKAYSGKQWRCGFYPMEWLTIGYTVSVQHFKRNYKTIKIHWGLLDPQLSVSRKQVKTQGIFFFFKEWLRRQTQWFSWRLIPREKNPSQGIGNKFPSGIQNCYGAGIAVHLPFKRVCLVQFGSQFLSLAWEERLSLKVPLKVDTMGQISYPKRKWGAVTKRRIRDAKRYKISIMI